MVLDFLAIDSFDFTRKIVKKNLGEKLVKMFGVVKIEFLDKNLTFRIVWEYKKDYMENSLGLCKDFAFDVIGPKDGLFKFYVAKGHKWERKWFQRITGTLIVENHPMGG